MVDADNGYLGAEHMIDNDVKAVFEKVEKSAQRLHEELQRRADPAKSTKPATTSDRQLSGPSKKTSGRASA